MTTATYPMTLRGNEDFWATIFWIDKDRNPIPTSGYSAKMQIRDAPGGTLIADFTTPPSTLVVDSAGKITAQMPKSVTSTLNWTRAYYDIVLISGIGSVQTILEGPMYFNAGISQ